MLGDFIAANGLSLAHEGKIADAALVTKDALEFSKGDAWIYYLYGRLIFKQNRTEAISHWETAMQIDPNYGDCAIALGHVKLLDHQYKEAASRLELGLKQFGNNGNAWLDLADVKIALHDYRGAADALDSAKSSRRPAADVDIEKRRQTVNALTGKK
jgi:tetratricopeptide (TPR) repeat protein